MKNCITCIDYWAQVTPAKVAHQSEERSITYQELKNQSDLLACYFQSALKDQDQHLPIAVLGHKEPEMLVAFLGAVKSGHSYIPIDISIPEARVSKIIETSQATLVMTPEKVAKIVEQRQNFGTYDPSWIVQENDPFYILFTSGSTGEPKGVIITRQCVESFINWHTQEQSYNSSDIFLNQAPFSFDLSVMDLYSSLTTGGTLVSLTRNQIENPALLYKGLAASGISVWVSTPSFVQLCLAEKTFTQLLLPNMRKFVFCGETLPPEIARILLERFPRAEVWNTYGPTEATVATTSIQITKSVIDMYDPLPLGFPKHDSIVKVASNPESEPIGEIIIEGDNVSTGYLGRPELTQKAFFVANTKRAYHTGDLGYFKDNMLFFIGRQDNQIKLHGHRIEIGDVEANLQSLSAVLDAVVVVKAKDGIPDKLVAFVILDEAHEAMEEQEKLLYIKTALAKKIPAYMVPRSIKFLKTFPMTPNGKADRKKLLEQYI